MTMATRRSKQTFSGEAPTPIRGKTFAEFLRYAFGGRTEEAESSIRDLARHGADGGWPLLTYTSDVVRVYDKFEDEIWEMLFEDADDFGTPWWEMLGSMASRNPVGSADQFKNLLVWYAAERTAQRMFPDE